MGDFEGGEGVLVLQFKVSAVRNLPPSVLTTCHVELSDSNFL